MVWVGVGGKAVGELGCLKGNQWVGQRENDEEEGGMEGKHDKAGEKLFSKPSLLCF